MKKDSSLLFDVLLVRSKIILFLFFNIPDFFLKDKESSELKIHPSIHLQRRLTNKSNKFNIFSIEYSWREFITMIGQTN